MTFPPPLPRFHMENLVRGPGRRRRGESMLRRARLSLGLAWGLFGAGVVWAQSVGGSIQGTVRDAGGAVLAGAQVVVRSVGTGSVHERATDPGGRYLVPLLPPGEYEVHFSLTGFGPVARRGVRLTVGQDAVVDATLQLGQRTEELVVEADASRVNLTSGAVSGLVGEEEIRDLPLNGRSFQQLALLQPGVQAALAAGNDVVGGARPRSPSTARGPSRTTSSSTAPTSTTSTTRRPARRRGCCWGWTRSSSSRSSPTPTPRSSAAPRAA